jgi:HAE1 family hydrophobic/amphiphilic exporter-1
MSKFFIRRPIVAIVIAIVTVILGVVSLVSLPTAQFLISFRRKFW